MPTKNIERSGQQNVSQVHRQGLGNPGPAAQRRRTSSMSGQHPDVGNDVKIELKAPLKTTLTTVLKKGEKLIERSDDWNRIANTDRLLRKNNVITDAERTWLKNLRKTHKAQYNQLGHMLKVTIFGDGPRHGVSGNIFRSGVSGTGDRNKIRMQILKAAVYEAMTTVPSDLTAEDREKTIKNALKAAEETRSAMFEQVGFRRRKLKAYKEVTAETLQNPDLFKEKYERKLANLKLYSAVQWPRSTLSSGISWRNQKRARAAVELLIDNDLLDKQAAVKLLKALRTQPQDINALMSDTTPRVEPKAEREKVRAMALLALAYNPPGTAKQMRDDLLPLDQKTWQGLMMAKTNNPDNSLDLADYELEIGSWPQKPKHLGFPNLSNPSEASKENRKIWHDWANPDLRPNSNGSDFKNDVGDSSDVIIEEPARKSTLNAEDNTGPELKVGDDPLDKNKTGQSLVGDNADGGKDDYALKPPPKRKIDLTDNESSSNDDITEDVGGDETEHSFSPKLIVEEPHKDEDKTGKIPQQPAPELQEKKIDIPQSGQPNQPSQFTGLEQDPKQDNRVRTDSADSSSASADLLSSMGSQSGDRTTQIRNETTLVQKTVDDGDSDNDDAVDPENIDDLYESDADDELLNEKKVTEEEERKLAAKNQAKTSNAEDNDNNTDKDSSIHSLSFGQLIDGADKEKSPSQGVNPDSENEYVHSLPVVLELNDNSDDDNKLVNAMGAFEKQEWPENPLGPKPFLEIPHQFTSASNELTDNLPVLGEAIKIVLDTYKSIEADEDNKRALEIGRASCRERV